MGFAALPGSRQATLASEAYAIARGLSPASRDLMIVLKSEN
jgi:hypothetical protein